MRVRTHAAHFRVANRMSASHPGCSFSARFHAGQVFQAAPLARRSAPAIGLAVALGLLLLPPRVQAQFLDLKERLCDKADAVVVGTVLGGSLSRSGATFSLQWEVINAAPGSPPFMGSYFPLPSDGSPAIFDSTAATTVHDRVAAELAEAARGRPCHGAR